MPTASAVSAASIASPRSRRARPAKPPLTRAGILRAALAVLRTEGLERVTMRRVAARLDTGAASLYVYVRDTEDLHAQLLDALLATLRLPRFSLSGPSWRVRLTSLLTAYMRLLFAHPGVARITMFSQPTGPHYLAMLDRIAGLLALGGIRGRAASWAIDLLLHYATATAVEQSAHRASPRRAAQAAELATVVAGLSAAELPHLTALRDELLSGRGPDRFAWGLEVVLTGIEQTTRTRKGHGA